MSLDAKLIELTKKGGQLDKYYKELKPAADANAAKWGYYFDEVKSYEEAIEGLRKWIDNRREWINNNLDKIKISGAPEDDDEESDIEPENADEESDTKPDNDDEESNSGSDDKKDVTPKEHKGSWKSNEKGWWYGDDTGWYAKDCWMTINSENYYFDKDGYMASNELATNIKAAGRKTPKAGGSRMSQAGMQRISGRR